MLRPASFGVVIVLALAGCTVHPPTVTSNPIAVSPDRRDVISICYDGTDHARRDIEAIALENCPEGTASLQPWRTDKVLNDCPMLKKSRVSFICVPAGGRR